MKHYFLAIAIFISVCIYIQNNRYDFQVVAVKGYGDMSSHEALVRLDRFYGSACSIHSFTFKGSKRAISYGALPESC